MAGPGRKMSFTIHQLTYVPSVAKEHTLVVHLTCLQMGCGEGEGGSRGSVFICERMPMFAVCGSKTLYPAAVVCCYIR